MRVSRTLWFCDEYTDTGRFQTEDDLLQIQYGDWIDAGKGLVEQDKGRIDGQAASNLDPAAFATGERISACFADVTEAEALNQVCGTRAPGLPVKRLSFQNREDVLLNGEFAKNRRAPVADS